MRDRDEQGRARNARSRDALGRPLPRGVAGVQPLPDDIDSDPVAVVALAGELLDAGLPFQAHEALEVGWKSAAEGQRSAWQGLAQLAVALTHAQRGNPVGARRLQERALANLAAGDLPDLATDLRERLVSAVEAAVEPLE